MTPEERFERIETNLQLTSELQTKLVEAQLRLTESVSKLTESVAAHVDESRAYVAESRARMAQIEANLDALIRAITAEHKNGKQKG